MSTPTVVRGTALSDLQDMFAQYGLTDLATQLGGLISNPALSDAQIQLQVQSLPAYLARFPGMAHLKARGEAINESTYISQERSYQDVLRNYGLPQGFYDQPKDFAAWMTNGVSPAELEQRVHSAQAILNSSDPNLMATAKSYYGLDNGSLLANVLDGTRAQPIIQRQLQTIDLGAAAAKSGVSMTQDQAYGYAGRSEVQSMDYSQMVSAMGQVGQLQQSQQKLAAIGGTTANPNQAMDAIVLNDPTAAMAVRSGALGEKARFEGRNAVGQQSLAQAGI